MDTDEALVTATLEVIGRLAGDTDDRPADAGGVFGRRAPDTTAASEAEGTARSILTAIGYAVSEDEVRSPQGQSSGMFSRRLAHVRVDLAARQPADGTAAVICHEAAHCLDLGPYDFDHPWSVTPRQRGHALAAQLVACLSSHAFVHNILGVDSGPGQLALAGLMVQALADNAELDPAAARDVAERVAVVTANLRAARAAPPWARTATREVAVDRGRGVMWLAVGPAAHDPDPPSACLRRQRAGQTVGPWPAPAPGSSTAASAAVDCQEPVDMRRTQSMRLIWPTAEGSHDASFSLHPRRLRHREAAGQSPPAASA